MITTSDNDQFEGHCLSFTELYTNPSIDRDVLSIYTGDSIFRIGEGKVASNLRSKLAKCYRYVGNEAQAKAKAKTYAKEMGSSEVIELGEKKKRGKKALLLAFRASRRLFAGDDLLGAEPCRAAPRQPFGRSARESVATPLPRRAATRRTAPSRHARPPARVTHCHR